MSRRAGDGWTDLSGGTSVALGSPTTVTGLCTGTRDVYLVTVLDFESNFENFHVSSQATRVECGALIANPDPPQLRPRDQKFEGTGRQPSNTRAPRGDKLRDR